MGLSVLFVIWGMAELVNDHPIARADGNTQKKDSKPDPLAAELEERLASDIRPLLETYCFKCHAGGEKKGGVTLDGPGDIASIMEKTKDWLTVVEVMNARLMPPEKHPQPSAHEVLTVYQWVHDASRYYPPDAKADPGWYTIHRLNRSEYRNTLRDLLGIDPAEHDLAADLPADDTGYGFDNIAEVLSMSPLQLEKYLDSAERAVELAFGSDVDPAPRLLRNLKRSNVGEELENGGQVIWANGAISGRHEFPHDGEYELVVSAYGSKVQGQGPRVRVSVGEQELGTIDITAGRTDAPQVIRLKATVKRGRHDVSVSFLNDAVLGNEDRNLWVPSMTIAGPLKGEDPGEVFDQVFFVQPTADDRGNKLPDAQGTRRITQSKAAREVIERFATRAYRRPVETGELGGLMQVYRDAREQGEDYEPSVKLALTAALVSPNFLYRPIAHPAPNDPQVVYTLSDLELASRLSYFLWSSMPDERLLELAERGELSRPEALRQETRRMLMDARADALVENFAGQWLLLRKLDGLEMDQGLFPAFNAGLREAMRKEVEMLFADVLRNNRSVLSFLDSRYTFVNETLARHYGIEGVEGEDFRLVRLPADSPRGGVLTMAATLTVTSHATRTSPVKRGDYVLSQLMGAAPPPPPADVPPLEQAGEALGEQATLREQLAAHVADPNCAVCHKRLDPIGLAMENFTAIGAWRDTEQGRPIDASGELPGGVRFNGPAQLKKVMLDRHEQFVENLSQKMLTYAIGRGTEPFDRPTIQKIAQAVADDENRMQALIEAVVMSDAFRKARGRGENR